MNKGQSVTRVQDRDTICRRLLQRKLFNCLSSSNMKYNYLPPLSNIRSSLKTRSREYILENSLHGVPYFADPTRPLCERGIWFVLTMASVGATIFTIITIWHKFQEEPTVTGLDTEISNVEITFPEVFVCFDGNQFNYSGVNDLEKKFYEKIYNWQWGEQINNTIEGTIPKTVKNYREIFTRLAPDCDTVLTISAPEGIAYVTPRFLFFSKSKFVKVITPVGICCKYIVTTALGIKDNPWAITFSSAIYPFRVYVMNPSDVGPMRDALPVVKLHIASHVRLEVYYTYATSDLKMLSRYQRQCYYEGEQSTYNNCRLNCISKDIFKKCRCLPWFLIENGVKECSLSEYSCVSKAYKKDLDCGCVLPCNFTAFQPTMITYVERKNVVHFIWPKTLFRREIRFGYLDLVVSFGGIAGLFLGYSILTSVEFFYYMSLRTYCGAVLDLSRKKNIITIREKKIKTSPKADIKFIHCDYLE